MLSAPIVSVWELRLICEATELASPPIVSLALSTNRPLVFDMTTRLASGIANPPSTVILPLTVVQPRYEFDPESVRVPVPPPLLTKLTLPALPPLMLPEITTLPFPCTSMPVAEPDAAGAAIWIGPESVSSPASDATRLKNDRSPLAATVPTPSAAIAPVHVFVPLMLRSAPSFEMPLPMSESDSPVTVMLP